LLPRLQHPIPAMRPKHTPRRALPISTIIRPVITLLVIRLHDAVPTVRLRLAIRCTATVCPVVLPVVARLLVLVLLHPLAATRPERSVRPALVVASLVLGHTVVALLARGDLPV